VRSLSSEVDPMNNTQKVVCSVHKGMQLPELQEFSLPEQAREY